MDTLVDLAMSYLVNSRTPLKNEYYFGKVLAALSTHWVSVKELHTLLTQSFEHDTELINTLANDLVSTRLALITTIYDNIPQQPVARPHSSLAFGPGPSPSGEDPTSGEPHPKRPRHSTPSRAAKIIIVD